MTIQDITVQELKALKDSDADFLLIDVRNPDEYAIANLGGKLIPLPTLPEHLNELAKNQHIIVHCQAGGRSRQAAAYLMQQGYSHVCNLQGGLNAWRNEIK